MRLFDTHCHFETDDRAAIAAVLRRARAAGVEKLMAVGGSPALNASAALAREIAAGAADLPRVLLAQGFDRDQVELPAATREEFVSAPELAAWGEIGLDYHYSPTTRSAQLRLFAEQLELARARALPVVIHTREADDDTLGVLREIPSAGIIHSFTGNPGFARQLLDLGFYISLSGIVTFRLADNVRESARVVPDDRLLIETDSPFLAPVPKRGQPNEPAFVRHTCEFLAALRGCSPEALGELTAANAERLLERRT